jgi:outer membrane receptor protein involved in Fe transport
MSRKSQRVSRNRIFQRKALALAIGSSVALGFAGGAYAQATTGTIYGQAPVASGETIQITGGAGFNRTITVGPSGRYSITLPVGNYSVSLLQDGKVVQTKTDVNPVAAGAVVVDFTSSAAAANAQTLSTVNVTANAIPAIDVTTTNQVTTITAKQLQQLPLARTAENIALLAPGVTQGSALLMNNNPTATGTPLLVFGGASVSENAYYVDGFNSTDALTGQGGVSLPYGAIEQQQTFTTGYGAQYGRAIGGVINQIGKSGSDEWHFGFKASWQPGRLRDDPKNQLWNNPLDTDPNDPTPGSLRTYRKNDSVSENIYDAYVSGPIVKDKLFFFLGLEQDDTHFNQVGAKSSSAVNTFTTVHDPKIYAKLNWNINANNVLSLTGVQNQHKFWRDNNSFDYSNFQTGGLVSRNITNKNSFRIWVANYTSYLSDNLTLHALFGKEHGEYFTEQPSYPGFDPTLPEIRGASSQNPAFAPPGGITNANKVFTQAVPSKRDTVMNYRLSLDYKWRTHDFQVGIDNVTTQDIDDGTIDTGPGYRWVYNHSAPGRNITGTDPSVQPFVGAPNSNPDGAGGYYVAKDIFTNFASVRVAQRAAYIEDNWQLTPNFLLNLGLRDDSFINYNPIGQPYIRLTKPQWAPRIGFSWDVHGDSSMKVFGNAGRYYLALPAGVALRGASASTFTDQYFTYSGIDANGVPTGLTPIPENPVNGVSQNNEYGVQLDPRTVAAQNVKAEYADEYVVGMQQLFHFDGVPLVFGATGVYKKLGRIIDDWDDQQAMCAAGREEGLAYLTAQACTQYTLGAVLINPGLNQTILVSNPSGGLSPVTVSLAQQGFQRPATRKYYALNLSLTHEWDGKWFGKIAYTFARNWGNTEGPVDSVIGQAGSSVSITEQWDFSQIMEYSYGLLPNDQRHQFKIYGAYALNPEWTVGANLFIASGHPDICLGEYPRAVTPDYGEAYHYCDNKPVPPGSTGFTPWTHELDLNVNYQPGWADHKLNFNLAVFNVFNNQTPLQFSSGFGSVDPDGTLTADPTYHLIQAWTDPRSVRFALSYDW